jgi:hypothetical protein
MPDTRRIIRVFLASPGDLQDERRAAKAVVDEFNKLWADALGHHVELVGWEDTLSQYGRPQGLINQDLARCELVIGMMWKRWGTPPSKTGPYTSGFEEEFEHLSTAVVRLVAPNWLSSSKKLMPNCSAIPAMNSRRFLRSRNG